VLRMSNMLQATPKNNAHISGGIVSQMFNENRAVKGYTKF
jgi:hypothetical protein